jgi:methylmalonyl-CoA carboxyltransferase small subunit
LCVSKYKLNIDGKTYEVDVEATEADPRRAEHAAPIGATPRASAPPPTSPLPAPAAGGSDPNVDESKVCRSPISGVVVQAPTQVGQVIQTGDTLMVLEAMKMETTITSPVGGKIAAIKAAVGESVQGGQILVVFE